MRSLVTRLLLGSAVAVLAPVTAQGQIVPDGTLGEARSQVSPEVIIRDLPGRAISGGAERGDNLFHSFEQFSIDVEKGAYFVNPVGIENIFSRITGSEPSNILGRLGVLGSANLYFMNPNGILFGPTASLDLQGAFVGTTADGIQFGEQGTFSAISSESPSQLLSIDPSAYLFSQSEISKIQSASRSISVPSGMSFTLLGGDITFQNSFIQAPLGGEFELGSVAEASRVRIDNRSGSPRLDFGEDTARGDISLDAGSGIFVNGAGRIGIHAHNVNMTNTSALFSFLFLSPEVEGIPVVNLGDSTGGNIFIDAVGDVTLSDLSFIASGVVGGGGLPNLVDSGNVEVRGNSINVINGSAIASASLGEGDGGDVFVEAVDSIKLSGRSQSGNSSSIGSPTGNLPEVLGVGSGGDAVLRASRIVLEDEARISSISNPGAGDAGNIDVYASDMLSINGGSFLSTGTFGEGDAGSIKVQAQSILLIDDALITSATFGPGEGNRIDIIADRLVARKGGQISAGSGRENVPGEFGRSGDVNITITDLLELDGDGRENRSGIFAETSSPNRAGDLTVETGRLIVREGAAISASASGSGSLGGDSGILTIRASDSIDVIGEGSRSSALVTEANGIGNAGDLRLETNRLSVRDGGIITSATLGKGNAGNIEIQAVDINVGGVGSSSGGNSEILASIQEGAVGNGGTVQIQTENLTIEDSGRVSAGSETDDPAGNVVIDATDRIILRNGEISTTATRSSGGNIFVNTNPKSSSGILILESDSAIETESSNDGGDVVLRLPVIAFGDSNIITRSTERSGGDIVISSLFSETIPFDKEAPFEGDGRVDINAAGEVSEGTIDIPDVSFLQNGLVELSENLVDTDQVTADSCITRSAQGGVFAVTATDSLPFSPQSTVSSFPTDTVLPIPSEDVSQSADDRQSPALLEPRGAYKLSNGRMLLSRDCSEHALEE